ncbi:MAG: hypothetical protein KDJ48_15500 [Nitratireductor sp.]|nr:hypothetical protein [Nitratireductor sp.]
MRKLKQGDLDGLCGIYAVMNAMDLALNRAMQGAVTPEAVQNEEFRLALAALANGKSASYLIDKIVDGTAVTDLVRVAKAIFDKIKKETDGDLSIKVSVPYRNHEYKTLGEFLATLENNEQDFTATILKVEYPESIKSAHWTVLSKIKSDSIKLLDSSGEKSMSRRSIAIKGSKTKINPQETVVITIE